jgi:rhodanese-related sulfurtransferase
MAHAISIDELKKLVADGAAPTVVDVRRKSDYTAAPQTIETARWRDPEMVDAWAGEIAKDRPVIVYCVKGGSVSQSVADRLMDKEVDVRYLEGGILAWHAAKRGDG